MLMADFETLTSLDQVVAEAGDASLDDFLDSLHCQPDTSGSQHSDESSQSSFKDMSGYKRTASRSRSSFDQPGWSVVM